MTPWNKNLCDRIQARERESVLQTLDDIHGKEADRGLSVGL